MPDTLLQNPTDKITEQERGFVDLVGNLSDAQVYLPLTPAQMAALPSGDFFTKPRSDFDILEEKSTFLAAFCRFHGGLHPPPASDVLFGYSASMIIEIVANALRVTGATRVGLLWPTYDATYHIFKRHGLELTPLTQAVLSGSEAELNAQFAHFDAVLLTLPNNPTGWTLDPDGFARVARAAAAQHTLLVVDACFRVYAAQKVDHYQIVSDAGCDFVVIEDTGKLFMIKDLKLGFASASKSVAPILWDIHRDFLLDVPLISLIALSRLLRADGPAHGVRLRETVARNRRVATDALAKVGLVAVGQGHSNVQLFRLPPGQSAEALQALSLDHSVGVVAANAYYWGDKPAPGTFIRIALARVESEFDRQIAQLRRVLVQPRSMAGNQTTEPGFLPPEIH